MKRLICLIVLLVLATGNACATIMEPKGIDLEFKLFSGIEAKRAVVLCRSLSARSAQKDNAKKLKTLSAGDTFLTWESTEGWLNCYYSDGKDPAWVRDYYVIQDPAYYVTDSQTAVYAYGDTAAPRVALLGRNEELPIILETDEWCVVSLRGAAGWIRKTSRDQAPQSWFQPEGLLNIKSAELNWTSGSAIVADPQTLAQIAALLSDTYDMGGAVVGCPFGYYLRLTLENGEQMVLEMASDNCTVYRIYGRYYRYGNTQHTTNQALYSLFPGYHQ